jgi:hypothetical protein
LRLWFLRLRAGTLRRTERSDGRVPATTR